MVRGSQASRRGPLSSAANPVSMPAASRHRCIRSMQKIDLKRELKPLYQASAKRISRVDVPALQYLMIDGQGDPNGSDSYAAAVQALSPCHGRRSSW